ncbi:hypothetical protein ACHAXS_003693, partial [Conticribra weissflogii]
VICGKDDAEVIKKSILTELTTGLQLIEDNEFVLTKNLLEGSIAPLVLLEDVGQPLCHWRFGILRHDTWSKFLGICATFVNFDKRMRNGHILRWRHLQKSRGECQGNAWYQREAILDIHSIGSFLFPLLQCLIGIGNDILNIFKDIVNEKIEDITPDEVTMRSGLVEVDKKVES